MLLQLAIKDGGHDGEHRHLIVSIFAATSMRCASISASPAICNVTIAAAHALVLLPIGQMPEALIIPSIMLRRGQNGMNAISSSYDWMRQRRKRRAACRSNLQPAYLGRKVHRGPNKSCLAIDFVIIGRHSKLRPDRYEQQDNGRLR